MRTCSRGRARADVLAPTFTTNVVHVSRVSRGRPFLNAQVNVRLPDAHVARAPVSNAQVNVRTGH